MAADISITITADPQQAVQAIDKVKKETNDLTAASKKVAQSSGSAGADAVGQVLSVSGQAQRSVGHTITLVGDLSGEIRQTARAASAVSGALGQSVPVIGQIGSALTAVLQGPIGMISAAIAAAVAMIRKMIAEAREIRATMASAQSAQANTALEELQRGRREYQEQLNTLQQVRELSAMARKSGLNAQETEQLRALASQVGISDKYVSNSGVRAGQIDRAAAELARARSGEAASQYESYLLSLDRAMSSAIDLADLNDNAKASLQSQDVFGKFAKLKSAVETGRGTNTAEQRAYADLYSMIAPLEEVAASYKRDALLGRSQSELNKEAASAVRSGVDQRGRAAAEAESERKAMAEKLARENAAIEKETQARESEAARRQAAADAITKRLQDEVAVQTLISQDKRKEAELLRQRLSMESALGRALTSDELSGLEALAGQLYDLRNPAAAQDPSLAPSPSARRRADTAWSMPLDRLQRIGANVTNPAASPEKVTLDRQLAVQEDIRSGVRALVGFGNHEALSVMSFT